MSDYFKLQTLVLNGHRTSFVLARFKAHKDRGRLIGAIGILSIVHAFCNFRLSNTLKQLRFNFLLAA